MLKKLYVLTIITGLFFLVAGVFLYRNYLEFTRTPVFSEEQVIEIQKGTHFRAFVNQIQELEANGEDWQWRLFARFNPQLAKLTVGEFLIDKNLTPATMMEKILSHDVLTYNFTIVEGMNWRELRAKLTSENNLISVIEDMSDEMVLEQIKSNHMSPEGLFLPETYQFIKGDSDLDILLRAHHALNQQLDEIWAERKQGLPYKTDYDLLIMASIVEKESAVANERADIAGVFVRRLVKNMRLQTDPTVIYGLGESYDGDIKTKDLKTDTPYNTYTRHGLPPTPIAMAGVDAIQASANPKEGTALYFVANNRGGHYFSDTYEQHQKAVKKYLKGMKL